MNEITQGSLFSTDFLKETIAGVPEWGALDQAEVDNFETVVAALYERFPTDRTPNESQTENDLIWPVLEALGWTEYLTQQNLSARGRDDVPDGLLFADQQTKDRANSFVEEWRRYELGTAIVESKRWLRPLDRRSGRQGEETAPSSQMLRYLRRVDDLTSGGLRWGILTNGNKWRLYYQGARSVSEHFFELDLAQLVDVPGHNEGLFALDDAQRGHWLRVFVLMFRKQAFLATTTDRRSFHQRALEEGKFYEERVSDDLSDKVFSTVFPTLVKAFAASEPEAPLQEVREAALIFLYRLLFIFYAEDRDLLPVSDHRYDDYALRDRVRGDVGTRKSNNDTFSETANRYWSAINDLCRAIDEGDGSIGLPPYNGGLFDHESTPLIPSMRIGDAVMASVIDALSYEQTDEGRKYINYRNLSVQQLGSIYERLLEYEVVREDGSVTVRPNLFARKGSGSYYTPDDLVGLIIRETIGPLIDSRVEAFKSKLGEVSDSDQSVDRRIGSLKRVDPAEKILELKICDPAMGSGHFLVSLVDFLADQVIAAMAEAEALVEFGDYISPLNERIDAIRNRILGNAEDRGWTIDEDQLDDRHIIRRMLLKRCIYGVDKNKMAVELAKVSLWLHTFTVGAPLSFLDHHLICGDSLFGSWVRRGIDKAVSLGGELLLNDSIRRAMRAASSMQIIEGLTDAEIAEAHRSADIYDEVQDMTAELNDFLRFIHSLNWFDLRAAEDRTAIVAFLDGQFGDPLRLLRGELEITDTRTEALRFSEILDGCQKLVSQERFLNWQVSFPGIWTDWNAEDLDGGFDAIIGNPPWDKMKMQEVEWFEARRPDIASVQRAADRKAMIAQLRENEDPLATDYDIARARSETAVKVARGVGDYPLLSGGDVNIYSLFIERALQLVKTDAIVGLLVPSGIASDKTSSRFFKSISTEGRLKVLYDFENKGTFFPDVHNSFKFCAFVITREPIDTDAKCAFFLHDIESLNDHERTFTLSARDFAALNPNTGTAPIFRTRRDAEITTQIYANARVLVDRSVVPESKAWSLSYSRMFDMTNDSRLFRTITELQEIEGAYPKGGNTFGSSSGDWVPLYVGKMVHQFDHRSASVTVNEANVHNAALSVEVTTEEKANPDFSTVPQYWIKASDVSARRVGSWALSFRDIARATDVRTMISAIVPGYGFGNTLPILELGTDFGDRRNALLLVSNLNAIPFDFAVRQKAQSTHLNWYIVEQLPFVRPEFFSTRMFGQKSAEALIRELAIELIYTSHDLSAFAEEMGFTDENGAVLAPFVWDDERRLNLRAKLDAIFFHLYGITERDVVRYIYSTFPIVEREEVARYGDYRTREYCLAYISALAAGDADTIISL